MKLAKVQAYEPIQIRTVVSGANFLHVDPIEKGKYSDYFSEKDLKKVNDMKLDIIVRFGFRILRGKILEAATYGIWSYHHCDEKVYRGGPACFWEIYNRQYMTGGILQRLTEKLDGGVILRKGHFKTIFHSYKNNINQVMYGSVCWVKQVCIDIRNGHTNYFHHSESASDAIVNKTPNNLKMFVFYLLLVKNRIVFHLHRIFYPEFWKIGIVHRPIETFLTDPEIKEVQWLPSSEKSSYDADPFGYVNENEHFLFYETYNYKNMGASITMCKLDKTLHPQMTKTLLKSGNHLSFPFVIHDNGKVFILPENYQQKQTELYHWNAQKEELQNPISLLDNMEAIDSSVVKFNDRWWLFCTLKKTGSNDQLFVYHSESLTSAFVPHANNPVKTDISSSRPAGTMFIHEGKLYRPAQDCSTTYGARIKFHVVTKLTTEEFKERCVSVVNPVVNSKYNKGLHTISSFGDYTLIDAKRYQFDFNNFRHQLAKKITKSN